MVKNLSPKAKKNKPKYRFPSLSEKIAGLNNFSDYRNPLNRVGYGLMILLLIVFSLIALAPILWLFFSSMKTVTELNSAHYHLFPQEWDWNKIVTLWNKFDFTRYYLNTFVYVLGAMGCAVLFNAILGYAMAILKPFGYKMIDKLIFLGYMIPAILNIFPLLMEIKALGFLNPETESYLTYLPLWLAYGANAYYYMLFKDYFEKLPSSLLEAAQMDGGGRMTVFFRVALPLARPMIGIVAIFAMTASYSDFLLPYLVLNNEKYQTLMVGIYRVSATTTLDASEFLLLLVLSIIPQVLIFLIFQKKIMGAGANTGSKE